MPEVFPHELLDAQQAVAGLEAAGVSHPHLLVTGQLVGRLARREMQVVAHPHEKLAGVAEGVGVGSGDTARMGEVVEAFGAVRQPPEPAHELDVAEPAG